MDEISNEKQPTRKIGRRGFIKELAIIGTGMTGIFTVAEVITGLFGRRREFWSGSELMSEAGDFISKTYLSPKDAYAEARQVYDALSNTDLPQKLTNFTMIFDASNIGDPIDNLRIYKQRYDDDPPGTSPELAGSIISQGNPDRGLTGLSQITTELDELTERSSSKYLHLVISLSEDFQASGWPQMAKDIIKPKPSSNPDSYKISHRLNVGFHFGVQDDRIPNGVIRKDVVDTYFLYGDAATTKDGPLEISRINSEWFDNQGNSVKKDRSYSGYLPHTRVAPTAQLYVKTSGMYYQQALENNK